MTSYAWSFRIEARGSKLLYTRWPKPISRVVSFVSFVFSRNARALPSLAAMSSSISITAWLAPPWRGPHSAMIAAEAEA